MLWRTIFTFKCYFLWRAHSPDEVPTRVPFHMLRIAQQRVEACK